MFKVKQIGKYIVCPPGAPDDTSPCITSEDGHMYCEECREMFNRLPIERRAAAMIKEWWKTTNLITWRGEGYDASEAWGVSVAKDFMLREQDEFFFDGWALYLEFGRRRLVIGRRVEI